MKKTELNTPEFFGIFKETLALEAAAIERCKESVTPECIDSLAKLYKRLDSSAGTLFFTGVGKSGIIGQKLASTFRSLGLRSIFLHPVEALHGDLGLVSDTDAIVYLSKSGTTEEILSLDKFINIPFENKVALLGCTNSAIAKKSAIVFDCSVEKEACLNNQAPTTSSTVALAMGDAMAVAYEKFRNLTKEDFAYNHPGGKLGKVLRMKVIDLCWQRDKCPIVSSHNTLKDVMLEMTKKNLGGCAVVDDGRLVGLMVEGDIRRAFSNKNAGLETKVEFLMTKNPIVVDSNELAQRALVLMENRKNQIAILPVVENEEFAGFIRIHDLIKEGLVSS